MSQILFLMPDDSMLEHTREVLAGQHADIAVAKGYATEAISIAGQFLSTGGEVVIARAGTADLIRNALNITVVQVPITGFDIIRSIQEAKAFGNKIAVVASGEMIEGIGYLAPILGVELRQYLISSPDDSQDAVTKAMAEKADVIIGGISAKTIAQRLGVPYTLLKTSRESILLAATEAKHVKHALQIEKAKRNKLNTLLDYAYEGIIFVDQDLRVTEFNPAVEMLTQVEREKIIGQYVNILIPDLKLDKVVRTGKDDLQYLLKIRGKHLLCNKVPIFVDDKVIGAVATMQDITKIQEIEARIRQQVYAKGHIARFTFNDILGPSAAIAKAINTAKHFARTDSNILILGQTGTGKEVFAQSIHNFGIRATGPFVAINCAALPAQLLESELFGYVAGAFTGASKEGKPGLFEVAHGGTIFLDEIADMDYVNQGRLLRVLQEKTVIRLGSDKVIPVDVRIIAATNKDLRTMVSANKFRDDLYFRLNVLRLSLPPLRERSEDIAEYAKYFVRKHALATNRKLAITKAGINYLSSYSWPGNVRELQNAIERAVAISDYDVIDEAVLYQTSGDEYSLPEKENLADSEEVSNILQALEKAKGRYIEAARILGIDRTTLWRRMRKLGIPSTQQRAVKSEVF